MESNLIHFKPKTHQLPVQRIYCADPHIVALKGNSQSYIYFFSRKWINELLILNPTYDIVLGIVRNIDVENKCFYILTPEPVERLNSVNALIKGNVELPSGYFSQVKFLTVTFSISRSQNMCRF